MASTPMRSVFLISGFAIASLALTAFFVQYSISFKYERFVKSQGFHSYRRECEEDIPKELPHAEHEQDIPKGLPRVERYQDFESMNQQPLSKIVYNRVGKCGSRSMLTLISKLAKMNKFTFYSSPESNCTRPSFLKLLKEVKTINDLPANSLYSRHIHFIDFQKYGLVPPAYINMVRDPIERFVSQYYFARYGDNNKAESRRNGPWKIGEKSMDINDCILTKHPSCLGGKLFYIVPYFCGQDMVCQRPSEKSLEIAKLHLIQNYLIVGYLEDFEGMLQVLEISLPRYFRGSLALWKSVSASAKNHTSTVHKGAINSTAHAVLRKRMQFEYEFYSFVQSRFRNLKKQLGLLEDVKLHEYT